MARSSGERMPRWPRYPLMARVSQLRGSPESTTTTLCRYRASQIAAESPAGPPPTIATSYLAVMRDAGCKFDSPFNLSGTTPSPSFEPRDNDSFPHSKQMKVAILDPASGIAGDMFLGALVDVGLDKAWLEGLPSTFGLSGVDVRIKDVERSHVRCVKVDFEIPPQPHGRSVSEIHRTIDAVRVSAKVARSA